MRKKKQFLRRYTNLADAIHILSTGKMALRNPSRWEDQNDRHFMERYQKTIRAGSLTALCFTSSEETYHHWRIYSNGYDGICFRLKQNEFVENAQSFLPGLQAGYVKYRYTKQLKAKRPAPHEWPFLKRAAFAGESEFRLVYPQLRGAKTIAAPFVPVEPDAIDRIILSPWLDKSLRDSLCKTLKEVARNPELPVYRSALIDYKPWRSIVDEDVEALA